MSYPDPDSSPWEVLANMTMTDATRANPPAPSAFGAWYVERLRQILTAIGAGLPPEVPE